MKRAVLFVVLVLLCCRVVVAQQSRALQQLLADTNLRWASVAIDVRSVEDGAQLIEYNSHNSLIPASITKLISTAFALDICGPDYFLQTSVYRDGKIQSGVLNGSLVIYGSGDPTLDSRYFPENQFLKQLVSFLHSKAISGIKGVEFRNLIQSEGRYNGTWLAEDVANYYGANWYPFNWHDNSCDIELRSDAKYGYFVSENPTAMSCEYNSLVSVVKGKKPDVWIYGGANGYREIRGVMDANMKSYKVKASMGFPEEYFKSELFKSINCIDRRKSEDSDLNEVLLFSHNSPTFAEIATVANRFSVNFYVEALANIAAQHGGGSGSYCEKIQRWLMQFATDYRGVIQRDACGLSPMNRIPASVFTELLLWGRDRWNGSLVNSLSEVGSVGTLKNFGRNYPLLNSRVRAKSGSMSGVRAMSGYITARSGKEYAFTLIANGFTASGSDVMNSFAKFLNHLYKEL